MNYVFGSNGVTADIAKALVVHIKEEKGILSRKKAKCSTYENNGFRFRYTLDDKYIKIDPDQDNDKKHWHDKSLC